MTESVGPGESSEQAGRLYVFLVAFVAAVGGFLFGYDLCIIAGAQRFLRETFALDSTQFGRKRGHSRMAAANPVVA